MIKNSMPISMSEAVKYMNDRESEVELKKFVKKFVKLDEKEAKKLRDKLESLNMVKLRAEHITKIIDFLPEDAESLNRIFTDIGLEEDESKKILYAVQEFK